MEKTYDITVYKVSDIAAFLEKEKRPIVGRTLDTMYKEGGIIYEDLRFIRNLFTASFPDSHRRMLGKFCTTTIGTTMDQKEYSNQFKKPQMF